MPRLPNSSSPLPPDPPAGLAKGADLGGCMVALHPDPKTAARLAVGTEPASRLHVTLAYLGKAGARTDHAAVDRVVAGWAQSTPPIAAQVAGAGKFTNGEEPVAHLSIDAPGLEDHRHHLARALADAGHPPKSDHGFTPHMTLAYGDGADDALRQAAGMNPTMRFDRVVVTHAGRRRSHELRGRR